MRYVLLIIVFSFSTSVSAFEKYNNRGLYISLTAGSADISAEFDVLSDVDYSADSYGLLLGYRMEKPFSIELQRSIYRYKSGGEDDDIASADTDIILFALKYDYSLTTKSKLYARIGYGFGKQEINYSHFSNIYPWGDKREWSGEARLFGGGVTYEISNRWRFGLNVDYTKASFDEDSFYNANDANDAIELEVLNYSADVTYSNFMTPNTGASVIGGVMGGAVGTAMAIPYALGRSYDGNIVQYLFETVIIISLGTVSGAAAGGYIGSELEANAFFALNY